MTFFTNFLHCDFHFSFFLSAFDWLLLLLQYLCNYFKIMVFSFYTFFSMLFAFSTFQTPFSPTDFAAHVCFNTFLILLFTSWKHLNFLSQHFWPSFCISRVLQLVYWLPFPPYSTFKFPSLLL